MGANPRNPVRLGLIAFLSVFLLGGCAGIIPDAGGPSTVRPPFHRPQVPPVPVENALVAGVRAGPDVASLGMESGDARLAMLSFQESCPRLISRNDASGLTRKTDWQEACSAVRGWQRDPREFFTRHFETVRVGAGHAYATGYFEPEIEASRQRRAGYDVPVYALPSDLVRAKPGDAAPLPTGQMPLGRYDASGWFVPYFDRAAIEDGVLAGRGLEIAWAKDPVEFFFLQVQGSGRLRMPDGQVIRIGYAGQNGHAYTGIGGVMRDRGLVGSGAGQYSASMQGIMQYIRENPKAGRDLMRANKSWIFFKEITGEGPVGALGVPIRAQSTVAADPKFVPLGAPVWLKLDRREADGLWIAQDTGGAIKGENRFDTFWGAGTQARSTAGGMSGRGQALLLLPKGTLSRLKAQ